MNDIDFNIIKKLFKKFKILNFDYNLAWPKLFIFHFYIPQI